MPYTKKYVEIPDGFDMLRGERRSIFLSNKLWDELLKMNHGICPVSEFIRQAILEKMAKEEPDREDYYKEMVINEQ
jgi:hypothetical protein